MPSADLDAIVRELADKEAIRDLARRYADCVWRQDAHDAAELFAEDGEMDAGRFGTIRGKAALREAYRTMLARGDFLPFVHNHVIELDGDAATGTCYLDLRATLDGKSMIGAGHYDDRYVREPSGAWKFHSRKLELRFLVPLDEGWARGSATS